MEQKINIAEILKNAPLGTELWMDAFGTVSYLGLYKDSINIGVYNAKATNDFWLNAYGEYDHEHYPDGVCVIFPSKDNRDWSTFKAPWKHKHFECYDKIMVQASYLVLNGESVVRWIPDLYGYWNDEIKQHVTLSGRLINDKSIIPFEGNEDKLGKEVRE